MTVTVNSDRYYAMLQNFLRPKVDDIVYTHKAENLWFQRDGASAHTSRCSLEIIKDMFSGHVVSFQGDIEWHPRSPDLTPCDFFLWGYLKSKVFQICPQILKLLRNNKRGCCRSTRDDSKSLQNDAE